MDAWDFTLGLLIGLGVGAFAGILVMALAVVAARSDERMPKLDADFQPDLGTDD